MKSQETVIYVPIRSDRAQWYFLNRVEAFRRQFDTDGDILAGFKNLTDALKAGAEKATSESFAVLRISFSPNVHDALSMGQLIDGDSVDEKTKAPLWRLLSKGCELISNPSNSQLWVQYVDKSSSKEDETPKEGGERQPFKASDAGFFGESGPVSKS